MKALEKDRTRRYQTAGDLGRDIQRHLADEPVEAGPPGRAYRVGKFVRRHRPMVLAGTMVVFSLVIGMLVAGIAWRRAVREAEDARRQAEKADAVTGLLDEMFRSASPGSAKGKDFTVRQLLDDFSRDFAGQLDREPEVEMTVRGTVGMAYEGLGDYVQAEAHLRRAHELARGIFGEEAVETMSALARVGWLTHEMGNSALGAEHLRRARTIQERKLGADHREALQTVAYLATVELAMGNTAGAEEMARDALDRTPREEESRADAIRLSLTGTLAGAYRAKGRDEEANALYTTLVEDFEAEGAQAHPRTFEAMHTMAELQIERGALDEAEALIR
jgi:tetratricopeptide (TPR) repeat protein